MGSVKSKHILGDEWESCGDNKTVKGMRMFRTYISDDIPIHVSKCLCLRKITSQHYICNFDTMEVKTICEDCSTEFTNQRCIKCKAYTSNTRYKYCNDCGKVEYNGQYLFKFDFIKYGNACTICNDIYTYTFSYMWRADTSNLVYDGEQIGPVITRGCCNNHKCKTEYYS